MKIALAQLNPVVGDLTGNCRRIIEFYQRAVAAQAELVVYPELCVVGYPPLDLVGRKAFVEQVARHLHDLASSITRVPALIGAVLPNPAPTGRPNLNVAALLGDGKIQSIHPKTRLPTYDVFDEDRYFEPAQERRPALVNGLRVGVSLCEDIWEGPEEGRSRYPVDPIQDLATQGIDLVVNLSASPFHLGRGHEREIRLGEIARQLQKPVLLVNQVGGNDSLLFDGRSFAVGPDGRVFARSNAFQEDLLLLDSNAGTGEMRPSPPEGTQEIFRALVMGLRDYMQKCSLEKVVLGLSGGVDSAVVAALAAEAVGPSHVRALAMPSSYSSPHSRHDAERLSKALGIEFLVESIDNALEVFGQTLRPNLGDLRETTTEENLQARIRGALIMAHSNATRALALATGNKSELATGYCTLYGDMAGGLAPIGDLLKRQVYELAQHINRDGEIIPQRIVERPPSAELRPNQTDQDTLPPYETLDPILDLYLTQGLDAPEIVERGFPSSTVDEVIGLVERSEHKRRQAAPVLRVTRRAFGPGRQVPVARGKRRESSA